MRCQDIINVLEQLASPSLSASWDNVGLLVGDNQQKIDSILLAIDITPEVLEEAIENNVDLIVTHHPMIFSPVKNITSGNFIGNTIMKLIQQKICVYAMHTNLDIAEGGVNDTLAKALDLEEISSLAHEEYEYVRKGKLKEPVNLIKFANSIKKRLGVNVLKIIGKEDRIISQVAVSSGAYSSIAEVVAAEGIDAVVTGDLKYHDALEISHLGLCAIDAGHFGTENIVLPVMQNYLLEKLGKDCNVLLSKKSEDIFKYI